MYPRNHFWVGWGSFLSSSRFIEFLSNSIILASHTFSPTQNTSGFLRLASFSTELQSLQAFSYFGLVCQWNWFVIGFKVTFSIFLKSQIS